MPRWEQAAVSRRRADLSLTGSNDLDGAGDLYIGFDVGGSTRRGEMGLGCD